MFVTDMIKIWRISQYNLAYSKYSVKSCSHITASAMVSLSKNRQDRSVDLNSTLKKDLRRKTIY